MSWNYRVVFHPENNLFKIHEVYYRGKKRVYGWTDDDIHPMAENITGLKKTMTWMRKALSAPIAIEKKSGKRVRLVPLKKKIDSPLHRSQEEYRVLWRELKTEPWFGESWVQIHRVYLSKSGEIESYDPDPVRPVGTTLKELSRHLRMIQKAFNYPTLEEVSCRGKIRLKTLKGK